MTDIARDAGECRSEVFFATGCKEITYKDVAMYMASYINRRLIQSMCACLDNMYCGKVVAPEQVQAYTWVIP